MPVPGDTQSERYVWILVTGAIGAFLFGWGTGSNDVANAFGTSVGAKTLTLKQAIFLAIAFEFTGALVLGRVTADTIAGGIARQDTFTENAPAFAFGMSIVLWLGFFWQFFASYMGWNVSATHSMIGGIVGFAMAWGGPSSVYWAEADPGKAVPLKGVVPIVLSWFISPVLTGAASALIYGLCNFLVLRSPHSLERSFYVLPVLVFSTVLINIYFVFTKGAKKSFSASDDWSDAKALWIAAVIGAGCSILSGIFGIPYLKYKVKMRLGNQADHAEVVNAEAVVIIPDKVADPVGLIINSVPNDEVVVVSGKRFGDALPEQTSEENAKSKMEAVRKLAMRGIDYDIHGQIEIDPVVAAIHANAKNWDPDTEYVFGFLQVISAVCVIFAHGAGEVGYMAGPLAVINNVVSNPGNNVVVNGTKVFPEIWVILIGAFGLVTGLATYGYKVCASVGTTLAMISPSRGFAAELATSFIIMITAQFGLPTSSSQCITGGIMGIAMFEGAKGINTKLLLLTVTSWLWTILVMAIGTAAIFSASVYAPNRWNQIQYNKVHNMTYDSLCTQFYNCDKDQYLKGCGVPDANPRQFSLGTCTNCTVPAKSCKSWQYLKGCGKHKSGSCTNCTVTTKCADDQQVIDCAGTNPGYCGPK